MDFEWKEMLDNLQPQMSVVWVYISLDWRSKHGTLYLITAIVMILTYAALLLGEIKFDIYDKRND